MFCPYCGNPCADSHKFCYRCGRPLPELTVQETVPEAPVPGASFPEEIIPAVTAPEETAEILTETVAAASDVIEEAVTGESTEVTEENTSAHPVIPEPQPKKGRLWPPVLLICLMVCGGLASFFFGSGGFREERSCFSIDNGVLYFDYSLYTGSDELTIPDTVDGIAVTAISDGCFRDCDRLTTIILPETVTIIGENAFTGCDALRGIYIPNGVLSVGSNALAECPALEAVSFPSSISEIGDGCLDHNESLQHIFYDGTFAQWQELYDGTYHTGVELHTNDGTYYATP